MLRFFLSLFFVAAVFSSAAAEMLKVPLSECPIKLNTSLLNDAKGDCMVDERSRGGSVYLVRYSSELVVFFQHGDAGTRYYPMGYGASGVKQELTRFNYIKKNWGSIAPHTPRTAYFNDGLKVALYTVNLQKERGCLAFAKGFGPSSDMYGADGDGYRKKVSMLVCPNGTANVTDDALIGVITGASLDSFR